VHALEEPQELVRAETEPIDTPTAFGRIARILFWLVFNVRLGPLASWVLGWPWVVEQSV